MKKINTTMRTVLCVMCLLLSPVIFAQASGEKIANASVKIAIWLDVVKGNSEGADSFIKYALARDVDNRSALLYQAKKQKGLKMELNSTEEERAKFINYLNAYAKKSTKSSIKLLHYKLVGYVQPENEDVLIIMTKASNAKIDTSYDSLHSAVFTQKSSTQKQRSKKRQQPKLIGSDPTANQVYIAYGCIRSGNIKMLRKVVEACPKLNLYVDSNYNTLLIYALNLKRHELAHYLILRGATLEVKDSDGYTPLQLSIKLGNMKLVKMMLIYEQPLNSQTEDGDTALHVAVRYKQLEAVKMLLEEDIDLTISNEEGQTAQQMAESMRTSSNVSVAIADYFEKKLKK